MHVYYEYAMPTGVIKNVSELLEMEPHIIICYHVDARNPGPLLEQQAFLVTELNLIPRARFLKCVYILNTIHSTKSMTCWSM